MQRFTASCLILILIVIVSRVLASNNKVARRDVANVPVDTAIDPLDVKHCMSLFLSHSLMPCISWGTLPEADKHIYRNKKCGSIITDNIMNYYFSNVTSKEDALARLQELQMIQELRIVPDIYASKPVVHKHEDRISRKIGNHSSSSLLMFGMQKEDMIYELRYPWQLYLCEGSIALDLGTAYGDSTFAMAVASRGVSCHYLINEWDVYLNPHLNVIPFHFGVLTEAAANKQSRWETVGTFRTRISPFISWLIEFNQRETLQQYDLIEKISFIKIDFDGLDFDLFSNFQKLFNKFPIRPLFLVEWYFELRDCRHPLTQSLWQNAKSMNYTVWDFTFTHKFDSCSHAIDMYVNGPVGKKAKNLMECGIGRDTFDLCDLLLVPTEIQSKSQRGNLCPAPLGTDRAVEITRAIRSAT